MNQYLYYTNQDQETINFKYLHHFLYDNQGKPFFLTSQNSLNILI